MKKYALIALLLLAAMPARAGDDLLNAYQPYAADTLTMLDRPHRSINELGSWLSDTVAEALAFTPGKSALKLNTVRPQFTEAGYKAYTAFLSAHGFGDALQKQTLALSTVVNSAPMLIGQGASAGRYAWAFELPVVLSTTTSPDKPPVSETVILRIQIGRNAKAPAPNGVLIESWQEFTRPPEPARESGGKPE